MKHIFKSDSSIHDDSEWISVSDLMAGLMVIFLFIAVVYIRPLLLQKEKALEDNKVIVQQKKKVLAAKAVLENNQRLIKNIARTWEQSEAQIYNALLEEFEKDLVRWNAVLERKSLIIRFRALDGLFDLAKAELKPDFKKVIAEFFPRYVRILKKFDGVIEEVRIEGHTSSDWNTQSTALEAYFNNMELSQARTRTVLEYAIQLPSVQEYRQWTMQYVTANGLSSSRLVFDQQGHEDETASRRVEFRVRTNAEKQIAKILNTVK